MPTSYVFPLMVILAWNSIASNDYTYIILDAFLFFQHITGNTPCVCLTGNQTLFIKIKTYHWHLSAISESTTFSRKIIYPADCGPKQSREQTTDWPVTLDAWPVTGCLCNGCLVQRVLQPLQWRHNGRDSLSNHQPHDCLLNRLSRRRSKKTSKVRVTGLCVGNSPVIGEFPAQMASNAENHSIWWRHHDDSTYWYTTSKHMDYLESPMETLVFDISIYWKWLGTIHEHLLRF